MLLKNNVSKYSLVHVQVATGRMATGISEIPKHCKQYAKLNNKSGIDAIHDKVTGIKTESKNVSTKSGKNFPTNGLY